MDGHGSGFRRNLKKHDKQQEEIMVWRVFFFFETFTGGKDSPPELHSKVIKCQSYRGIGGLAKSWQPLCSLHFLMDGARAIGPQFQGVWMAGATRLSQHQSQPSAQEHHRRQDRFHLFFTCLAAQGLQQARIHLSLSCLDDLWDHRSANLPTSMTWPSIALLFLWKIWDARNAMVWRVNLLRSEVLDLAGDR
jgi:hypothetical protein